MIERSRQWAPEALCCSADLVSFTSGPAHARPSWATRTVPPEPWPITPRVETHGDGGVVQEVTVIRTLVEEIHRLRKENARLRDAESLRYRQSVRGGVACCSQADPQTAETERLIAQEVLDGYLSGRLPSTTRVPRPKSGRTLLEEIGDERNAE